MLKQLYKFILILLIPNLLLQLSRLQNFAMEVKENKEPQKKKFKIIPSKFVLPFSIFLVTSISVTISLMTNNTPPTPQYDCSNIRYGSPELMDAYYSYQKSR